MRRSSRIRWYGIGAAIFVAGIVAGILVPSPITLGDPVPRPAAERPMLVVGGSVLRGTWTYQEAANPQIDLPQTAAEAVAAGWEDPVLCAPGRGKYFKREQAAVADPYFLMYDNVDELIGIYMFADSEMPSPWTRLDDLTGGSLTVIDHEHWGLFVYFSDPTRACATDDKTGLGTGNIELQSAVRSYEAPPTPTPLPSPSLALEATAATMAALTSLSTTSTTEPVGLALAEDVQPSDISEIMRAVEGPMDTDNQWFDNKPHRGISGTVLGENLVNLVPSAAASARVTVKIWLSDTGVVRQIRIEGATASGDPDGAVRILDVSGSE